MIGETLDINHLPELELIVESIISRSPSLFTSPLAYDYIVTRESKAINVIVHREEELLDPPLLTFTLGGATEVFNDIYKGLVNNIRFNIGVIKGWVLDYPIEDLLDDSLLTQITHMSCIKSDFKWPLYKTPILNDLLLSTPTVVPYLNSFSTIEEDPLSFWIGNLIAKHVDIEFDSIVMRVIKNDKVGQYLEFLGDIPSVESIVEELCILDEDLSGSFSIKGYRELGDRRLLQQLIDKYKLSINI